MSAQFITLTIIAVILIGVVIYFINSRRSINNFIFLVIVIFLTVTISIPLLVYFMGINAQSFNQITSGFQNIIFSLAIIIGAWWTIFEFGIGEKLSRGAIVSIENEILRTHSDKIYINTNVTVENTGSLSIPIDWVDAPLSVFLYDTESEDGPVFTLARELYPTIPIVNPSDNETVTSGRIKGSTIGKGSKVKYTFCFPVKDKGVYYIRFRIPVRDTMTKIFGLNIYAPTYTDEEKLHRAMMPWKEAERKGSEWSNGVFLNVE